jgi:hypothetical protein
LAPFAIDILGGAFYAVLGVIGGWLGDSGNHDDTVIRQGFSREALGKADIAL